MSTRASAPAATTLLVELYDVARACMAPRLERAGERLRMGSRFG